MFDMSHLGRIGQFGKLAPESLAGFRALDKAALAEGAIPRKYKELMAVAVALSSQCPYCIEVHRKAARAAGASEAELAETVFVATAVGAGAALTHGSHLFPPE